MRRYLPTALIVIIAIVALAACNEDGATPSPTETDVLFEPTVIDPIGAPPSATDTGTTTPAAFDGNRDPVEVLGGNRMFTPLLADVRAASHEGFDRVIFDFGGAVRPVFLVEYMTQPIQQCGSGNEETVAGSAFIQVRMRLAAAHDDEGQPTFGMTELFPGLPSLLEVQQICDFEGTVTWVLGLSEEVDFNVFVLTGPFRLAVDVAHPSTPTFHQDDARN